MACVFLLTFVAVLQVSTAYPPYQLRGEKADVPERCPVTIEVPRWFCNAMESKERPDWLNTICKVVEPKPETQEAYIDDQICQQPTVDDRIHSLRISCAEGRISGPICMADRHYIEEEIRRECGTPRGNPPVRYPAMQRWRRSSNDIVDVICSRPRDPGTRMVVEDLCSGNQWQVLGRLRDICSLKPYHEQDLINLCGGTQATRAKGAGTNGTRRAKVSTNAGPTYTKEQCQAFMNPGFPTWLEWLCNNKEKVDFPNIDFLRSLCNESDPVQVLRRGCLLTLDVVPEHICSSLKDPGYVSSLYLACRPNEMDPKTYDIPRSVCTNLEELLKRCGIDTGVATPSQQQTVDSDVEDKREMTRIPDWICNNLSKLGLPDFIGTVCKTNYRLPEPDEICKPSLEQPNVPHSYP